MMPHIERSRVWLEQHRSDALDVLRMYLGVALFAKGATFVANGNLLLELIGDANIPFGAALLAHYVILAHLAGGAFLAVGLLTRTAAMIQIPALLGAIFYVHRGERLFGGANLQLEILVLFMLGLFSLVGAGRLSVESWIWPEDEAMRRAAARRSVTV